MTERIIDLVNGELDGTNTTSESVELAGILETDSSASAFFLQSEALFSALGSVPEAEPPADLKQRIMESIGSEIAGAAAATPSFMTSIQKFFQPVIKKPVWAMSYAFAAGLLVGVAALNLAGPGEAAESQTVQGTIGRAHTAVLDEASLKVGDVAVDLTTIGRGHEIMLDVSVAGTGEAVVRIYDMNDSSEVTSITASGSGHYTVSLKAQDELVVTVTSSGQEASAHLSTSPA